MDESQFVESEQQNPLQEKFRNYLNHGKGGGRWANMAHEVIAPSIINDQNRALFVSEWVDAVKSTKDTKELHGVVNHAFDPHQNMELGQYLVSKIQSLRPELKGDWFKVTNRVPSATMALNPEYDSVRKAVGERLQQLGINVVNSDVEKIFHSLLPNPYEYFTRTTYKTERVGKIFKKNVQVPVEESVRRLRPYEELLGELFRPTGSLPLPQSSLQAQAPK